MRGNKNYDFSGWATRNNVRCSDGRTIRANAFKHSCGKSVPLIWNHNHGAPEYVIGHADLENREEGVYAFCTLNDTKNGDISKVLIKHGDIVALSIYANHLQQNGNDVIHGDICEVSLVHKGANPDAFIEHVLVHGEEAGEEACIYFNCPIELAHADSESGEEANTENEEKPKDESEQKKQTLDGVFETMNEDQKIFCYAMAGAALEKATNNEEPDKEEKKDMKHNAFDMGSTNRNGNVLCHADQVEILNLAKNSQVGTLKNALNIYAEENGTVLMHSNDAPPVGGFTQDTSVDGNITWLFPEYKDVRPGEPELITYDQGWVTKVLNKVHKSPISRIRTRQVDIRNIESIRGKGFMKGNKKNTSGNFKLARRTTDPQTVYVKNALHKDDIIDITDFDYVKYLYNIDRMMLNEELATAIMIGDGREDGDDNKIYPEHIRPIWLDDELYTMHVDVDIDAAREELQGTETGSFFGDNYVYAEAIIEKLLYARENYKGSGTPDLYCEPHLLNRILLARDRNGRRIFNSVAELASTLNVGSIETVEQFHNKTRTVTVDGVEKTKKLLALVANLADYSLGSTKGGEIAHFTQFDIDFNQEKSLIETRCSGALTRVYSAIALEEEVNP